MFRKWLVVCYIVIIAFTFAVPLNCYAYDDSVDLSEDTYNTLAKGTTVYNGVDYGTKYGYNPLYYFLNYNDLRIAFGADPAKLVEHYAIFGIKEKRVANKLITRGAHAWGSSNEYIVPSNQLTKEKKDGMVVIPEQLHNNGGMNRRQDAEARSIAKQLANSIYNQVMVTNNNNNKKSKKNTNNSNNASNVPVVSEIQMVAYATGIVQAYCNAGRELTQDEVKKTNSKVYRTAYGVFCAHEFTSAGATRALGLILDYLDATIQQNNPGAAPLKWVHVNANTWAQQYCQIACDNHEAYADGILGIAGYGKHPLEGGVEQDIQNYVNYATLSNIINTRPPYGDNGEASTEDLPKNDNPMSGQANDY
ncbi:hypothetical protein [Butyrivibrio sp. AE2015]|uniref:hypothetical protein n=1 Tax=Butyrivibrio sp. AE2015 TaxID=1280663 RepID=UPI0003B31055|nr:hypothetical protein [Butyrivibrio sp. AE2015]